MASTTTNPYTAFVRQALTHGSIVLALFVSLFAASSWIDGVHSGTGYYLVAAWSFLCGLAFSHIIHEWCHYAGARLAKSTLTLKPRVHPLFFDFDLEANTSRQFLYLSLGGLIGNLLLLAAIIFYAAPGSIVSTSLLAAVLGQLVFVLMLELPVSVEVITGKDPLAALGAHFGQGGPLFLRAAVGGVSTAVLVFLLY